MVIKKMLATIISVAMVISMSMGVSAASVSSFSTALLISGTSAISEADVTAPSSTKKITATVYLEEKNGSSWKSIKSVTVSAEKSHIGKDISFTGLVKGKQYRARMAYTVTDKDGSSYSNSFISATRTC